MTKRPIVEECNLTPESFRKKRNFFFAFAWLVGIIFVASAVLISNQNSKIVASDDIPFITTWRVAGDDKGRTIIIPVSRSLSQYAYLGPILINFTIDWGDGTSIETVTNASMSVAGRIFHTYANPGDYKVKINGSFPGWNMGALSGDARENASKIISLDQWGNSKWRSMESAFYYAENMIANYSDKPDTSLVTNMHQAFAFARKFNGRIDFDTRNVDRMSSMFHEANSFNSPVIFSDTSKVTDMGGMFLGAVNFNQPINFNTTNVTNMGSMFQRTTRFNQQLSLDTRNVTNMRSMFQQSGFNQPLNFNTSKVENMASMFMSAPKFNQPLNFDTRNVKNMSAMFYNSPQNSPLNFSDTSQVTNMSMMFRLSKFNQPLNFDTRSVTSMEQMFSSSAFNQPINFNAQSLVNAKSMFSGNQNFNSALNLSNANKLVDISGMFNGATKFNQPITFATSAVTNMKDAFNEATAFNQDLSKLDYSQINNGNLVNFVSGSGLSTANNDRLIARWRQQLSGLGNQRPNSDGLKFCKSEADRAALAGNGWVFTDTRDCSAYMQAPLDISLSSNAVAENSPINTHFANISVQNHPDDNPDDVNTVTIGCAVAGADDASFTVDGSRLIFKPVADYEVKNSYNLCLRATDTANLFKDKKFTILVKDINETPVIENKSFSVVENSNNGTEFGQVAASDPDNGQNLSYEIVSGNDWGMFEMTNDGKLRVKNNTKLDYEQVKQVVLGVKVKDNGTPQLFAQANITVRIMDVNEAPIFTSANNITIDEDQTLTHNLTASDPENANLIFSVENLQDWMSLVNNQITFSPRQAQVGTHQIVAKVNDGENIISQTIQIRVNNVNDAPMVVSSPELKATKFQEYSYIISASDEDGDSLTYGVTKKPSWLNFDSDSRKLSGIPGNSEAGKNYEIILTVRDGNVSVNQSYTLQVLDKNYAPVINNQSFNLDENKTNGSEVYQVVASDPDNNPISYEIVAGNDLGIFEISSNGKIKVRDNRNLNYEEVKKIVLRLKVKDNQSPALSAEAEITVNIQDVNEAPVFTSLEQIHLKHTEAKTHRLSASDPEGSELTFMAPGLPSWIRLVQNDILINPDQNNIGDHQIVVKVSDGVNTTNQNLKIKVLAGNVAPELSPQTFNVAENSANGTVLGQIVASDFNTEDILSYELISGNDEGIFEITGSGQLKVKNNTNLDYEKNKKVILVVKVKDNQNPSLSDQDQITINVADVNEAPVFTSPNEVSLKHTESKIHNLTATDVENNAISFAIVENLAWAKLTGSQLEIKPSLNEVGEHEVNIKVSDGVNTVNQLMRITVIEENIKPIINDQNFLVDENSTNDTEIDKIVVSDENKSQKLALEIIEGNDLGIFGINDEKLVVKNNANLDYERVKQVVLKVRVSDNGSPVLFSDGLVTIDIVDIDDEAPSLTVNNNPITIGEGESFNPPVATCYDSQSTCTLTIDNRVNVNKPGLYKVIYTAIDLAGNRKVVHLDVRVKPKVVVALKKTSRRSKPTSSASPKQKDNRPPFVLKGDKEMILNLNEVYNEPGVECVAVSNCAVEITGKVDTSKAGVYTVIYRTKEPAYSIERRIVVKALGEIKQEQEKKGFWGMIWDFIIKCWWILILVLICLWWMLLFLLRRRREEEEEEKEGRRTRRLK